MRIYFVRFIIVITLVILGYLVGSKIFELVIDPYVVPLIGMRPILAVIIILPFILPVGMYAERIILGDKYILHRSKKSEMGQLRKIFRSFLVVVFILFVLLIVAYYQVILPIRNKNSDCSDRLANEINENNMILQNSEVNVERACKMHKITIEKADICFSNVVKTNLLSKILLQDHEYKRISEIKKLQQAECKDYLELIVK